MISESDKENVKELLEAKFEAFNSLGFIENDPIQIPHLFEQKEDIEISAFLTAIIAWGKRNSIIKNAKKMMSIMGDSPHDFVMNHSPSDLQDLKFVHRTFQSEDLIYFIKTLRSIYAHSNLENEFSQHIHLGMKENLSRFHASFLSYEPAQRTRKHIANPNKGSSAKRINMFMRWMIRKDNSGVDFGIWDKVSPAQLYCPLDVHTGNIARKLGLISRKANDWKSLEELMSYLREFDPTDPVKYDFALFGMGVKNPLAD